MRSAYVYLVVALGSWPGTVTAQQQQQMIAGQVQPDLKFYECVDPERTPACRCVTEAEMQTHCQPCRRWEEIVFGRSLNYAFAAYEYSPERRSGLPAANFFARDAAEELYGVEYPRTAFGYPVTTSTLYENYDSLGWSPISEDSRTVGSLAVWRGGVGIVVADTGGVITVLYSSAARGGSLIETRLDYLTDPDEARFIIPRDWVTNASGVRREQR